METPITRFHYFISQSRHNSSNANSEGARYSFCVIEAFLSNLFDHLEFIAQYLRFHYCHNRGISWKN